MLRKIIVSDRRLGGYGFYNSFYAGGSCLAKDTSALSRQLEKAGVDTEQIRKVLEGDCFARDHFYDRVIKEAGFLVKDKKIAVLGLSFKRDTGDIRNSGAIMIIEKLMKDGAGQIKVYDPACMEQFKSWAGSDPIFSYCESEEEALANTDGCFILTDWPQFSTLDQLIEKICPPPFVIADGRRMISHSYQKLQTAGYDILAVGSPFLKGFTPR